MGSMTRQFVDRALSLSSTNNNTYANLPAVAPNKQQTIATPNLVVSDTN